MRILTVVMAHGDREAQATFDRHLPFWRAHCFPILVVCPEDSPVRTGFQMLLTGAKQHHGYAANRRFHKILQTLEVLDYGHFLIFEYDSICLTPDVPEHHWLAVAGNAFTDDRERRIMPDGIGEFQGTTFIHPPLSIRKTVISEILKAMNKISLSAEYGCWDRYLGLACERGSIPIHSFRADGIGWSTNTIDASYIDEACAAVRNGAAMLHGVKSKAVLDRLVDSMPKKEIEA